VNVLFSCEELLWIVVVMAIHFGLDYVYVLFMFFAKGHGQMVK